MNAGFSRILFFLVALNFLIGGEVETGKTKQKIKTLFLKLGREKLQDFNFR